MGMSLAESIPSWSRDSGCSRKTTGTSCAKGRPHLPKPTKLHRILPAILQRSRDFRHPLTPTEAKVWRAVRRRQLGFKIRNVSRDLDTSKGNLGSIDGHMSWKA